MAARFPSRRADPTTVIAQADATSPEFVLWFAAWANCPRSRGRRSDPEHPPARQSSTSPPPALHKATLRSPSCVSSASTDRRSRVAHRVLLPQRPRCSNNSSTLASIQRKEPKRTAVTYHVNRAWPSWNTGNVRRRTVTRGFRSGLANVASTRFAQFARRSTTATNMTKPNWLRK